MRSVGWRKPVALVATAALWLVVTWPLGADRARASEGRQEFSERELDELAAGELVVRPQRMERDGRHLIGGGSWQMVDVPPDVLWAALLDTGRYSQMLPQVANAKIVGRQPGYRELYVQQGTWPLYASYYLVLTVDEQRRQLRFRVDQSRPGSLDAGWGFVHVQRYAGNRSLLAFGIMADVGSGILASVARGTLHEWMLKVPWTVKRFLESGGKSYYACESCGAGE